MPIVKDLNRVLRELVDYEVDICYGDDFYYDCDNGGTIYYTLDETYDDFGNVDWKEFLMERFNFELTKENWFLLSILHELGHHYTIDFFSNEDWSKMCEVLDSDDHREVNFDHFYKPNEIAATEWAIEYYKRNPKEMKKINRKINKILTSFEKCV